MEHCERVFRGLVAFLDRIGVVEGAGLADDEEPHHFGSRQTLPVIARAAGPFVTTRTVGTWLSWPATR